MLERAQPGIFSQLVAVPLFADHAILIQTAGHNMNVLKGIPSLTVSQADIEYFASALEQTLQRAQKIPAAMMRFALKAARARAASARQPPFGDHSKAPRREPRRDRAARLPCLPRARDRDRRRRRPRRHAARCTHARRTRRWRCSSYLFSEEQIRAAKQTRRRRDPSRLRLPRREPRLRRGGRGGRPALRRPARRRRSGRAATSSSRSASRAKPAFPSFRAASRTRSASR